MSHGELDSRTAAAVFNALRLLNRQLGITIIVVTHDQSIASAVDRTIAIRDGRTSTETVRLANMAGGDADRTRRALPSRRVRAH